MRNPPLSINYGTFRVERQEGRAGTMGNDFGGPEHMGVTCGISQLVTRVPPFGEVCDAIGDPCSSTHKTWGGDTGSTTPPPPCPTNTVSNEHYPFEPYFLCT